MVPARDNVAMPTTDSTTYTAFAGDRRIATGALEHTVRATKRRLDRGENAPVLIFEDQTGVQVDFDWRGTADDVVARLARHPYLAPAEQPAPRRDGPGRPRLGVVSREVSLLPRHWTWLGAQPGGASAAIRRLVDEARRHASDAPDTERGRAAAGRFMTAMAGDRPNFEEATRALFAGDRARLKELSSGWPADVRSHLAALAERI